MLGLSPGHIFWTLCLGNETAGVSVTVSVSPPRSPGRRQKQKEDGFSCSHPGLLEIFVVTVSHGLVTVFETLKKVLRLRMNE